ncbi:Myb-like transcription factor family protein [Quillaja saponaria]|uniref:Myb-like transcription factor family protein n=1 Tax=Quillaja saponaria TaxID=32244 RepID=A0AAD7L9G0_QUISA|nr:Myb-like transcription factor family protein [Quillaja saponaria]
MQQQRMGFREYVEALELEKRKIEVFQRELPLCLELITQAIETCRKQSSGTTTECNLHGHSECSVQTSTEGPVLEEFIPIKKRASSNCEDEDDDSEQHSHKAKISKDKNTDKKKSDWLRSVQLWNSDPTTDEDVPKKAMVMEVTRNGGAFQPFQREKSVGKANASTTKAPTSAAPVPANSSTAGAVTGGNAGTSKKEEKEGQSQRKQRRCWSPELHKRFLHALQQLGGPDVATPKQIRDLMKVDGLTNDEVKSHLQKFRLHTKRPNPTIHSNANQQTPQLIFVGGILMQPSEYAAMSTSTASGELSNNAPNGIYAPVALHPSKSPRRPTLIQRPQPKRSELSEQSPSEERGSHSEGRDHSNSPATSSSTHTTTTSPV